MANEDVYSTKDSNKNRKIEKRENGVFNALIFLCIALFCGYGFYHGYLKPKPNPVSVTQPVVPVQVKPPGNTVAHPYDDNRAPYEQ